MEYTNRIELKFWRTNYVRFPYVDIYPVQIALANGFARCLVNSSFCSLFVIKNAVFRFGPGDYVRVGYKELSLACKVGRPEHTASNESLSRRGVLAVVRNEIA